jgi:hypothetical protein
MSGFPQLAFLLLAFSLLPCRAGAAQGPAGPPPDPAKVERANAIKQLAFWRAALARPLEQRIGAAPAPLLEYVDLDNQQQGFPNKPRPPVLPAGFMPDVRAALAGLPAPVRRAMASKLAGIHFVDNLGSTGWTEEILDAQGRPVAGVIVLDAAVLAKQRANSWATWKESTPFKPDPHWRLAAQIERPADDNRVQAIQYILLHEMGHVLAIGTDLHPNANLSPADLPAQPPYPFYRLSWGVSPQGRYATRYDAQFPQRKDVVYYLGAKLAGAQMAGAYKALESTNFATLYAVTNPFDDFAEAFVTYVHTEMMGRPFKVQVFRDGKPVVEYGACWREARCADKRKFVEKALGLN